MKYYVYALIDPRDQQVFYIGKGHGNRHTVHLKEWQDGCVKNAAKFARIGEIVTAGFRPVAAILLEGLSEPMAYSEERRLIETIGIANLTNVAFGQSNETEKLISWVTTMLPRLRPFSEWMAAKPRAAHEVSIYHRYVEHLHFLADNSERLLSEA